MRGGRNRDGAQTDRQAGTVGRQAPALATCPPWAPKGRPGSCFLSSPLICHPLSVTLCGPWAPSLGLGLHLCHHSLQSMSGYGETCPLLDLTR